MTRTLLSLGALLMSLPLLAVGRLEAQRPPAIMAPKAAAARAAAATEAHITAMTEPGRDPAPAARPSAAAPRGSGRAEATTASTGAVPAARTATSVRADTAAALPVPSPAGDSAAVAVRGGRGVLSIARESFTYVAEGRRDPFFSLIKSGELRPMLSDLRLATIIYARSGRSVAILRDKGTKEQYRVREGQQLGRMRVAEIQPKAIVFTIEEYGFSRQETLALTDSTTERTQ